AAMFGYSAEAILDLHIGQLLPMLAPEADAAPCLLCQHPAWLALTQTPHSEPVGVRQDGTTLPLGLTVSDLPQGLQLHTICIFDDLSTQQLAAAQLHSLTFTDALTGLPNRSGLMAHLHGALLHAAQNQQWGALLFLDLDHFRQANEMLGPGCGDELLREAGHRLLACVRAEDTVAHFGGDEFMVLLGALGTDQATAANRARAVASKALQALSQPYSLGGLHYKSSASIGLVLFDSHLRDVDELLKTADAAMYQAKAAGRNAARFYDPAVQAMVLARTSLEKDLERALAAHEFVLHYQLQVNTQGVPLGAEALVRWQHPQRGLVMPGEFIALAEATRLILPLGQWVLETACQQLTQWTQRMDTSNWIMAVNVSALQFAQADFVASVTNTLARSGANPQRLELELTESMLLEDLPAVLDKIARIRALGVRFSLDDFGTGYSSLAHLKRLGMDQLKIDQSFVRDLNADPEGQVIAETIIYLGHNFGMQVIAEGVETEAQYQLLAHLGCDAFQGYLFAKPAAAESLLGR
ncbi:MAG: diguanylate cyclase, partial [Comamonadaceae bacterium CG_4_10_14_3_um_filter_60_75]